MNKIDSKIRGKKTGKSVVFLSKEAYDNYESTTKNNTIVSLHKTRCNKCLACRIYKGYEWSNRLLAEKQEMKYAWFITYTFNDLEIGKVDYEKPMVQMQLYMKRLRKSYKNKLKIRHYSVAELGGETLRFHYHQILYADVDLFSDMYFHARTKNGTILYRSPMLEKKLWKNGGALIALAEINSMRYTANYVNKSNNLGKCFSRGLGESYIKNKKNNEGTYIINGKYSKVPRYIRDYEPLNLKKLNDFKEIDNIFYNQEDDLNRAAVLEKQFFRKKT